MIYKTTVIFQPRAFKAGGNVIRSQLRLRGITLRRNTSASNIINPIDRTNHPLRALIRSQPAVALAETLDVARLEEAEDVAGELRAHPRLGAQAGGADDGA